MTGFDHPVPSSPFEKGGRGDLQGVAMRMIVARQLSGAHENNCQRPHRREVSRHTTWCAFRRKKGAALQSGAFPPIQRLPGQEGKIPPTPLCESGAQETWGHMTHSNRGRPRFRIRGVYPEILVEGLKQGSPDHESVHQEGRTAGVGSWETSMTERQMKEYGTMYSV